MFSIWIKIRIDHLAPSSCLSDKLRMQTALSSQALVSKARFWGFPSPRMIHLGYRTAQKRMRNVPGGLGLMPEITCAWRPLLFDGSSPSPEQLSSLPSLCAHCLGPPSSSAHTVGVLPLPLQTLSPSFSSWTWSLFLESFPFSWRRSPVGELQLQPEGSGVLTSFLEGHPLVLSLSWRA